MILRAVQGPSCLSTAWPLCLEKGRASQPGLWWSSEGWGQPLLLESAMVVGPRSPRSHSPHLDTCQLRTHLGPGFLRAGM